MVKNDNASNSNTATATQNNTQRKGVFVLMSEAQHRTLKVRAAQTGSTLQNLVSGLLNDALDKEPGEGRRGRRSNG